MYYIPLQDKRNTFLFNGIVDSICIFSRNDFFFFGQTFFKKKGKRKKKEMGFIGVLFITKWQE